MWSNLNDSFTAISGHISSITQTVNNSIPAFGDTEKGLNDIKLRELETKCSVLKQEVERQRQIGCLYKDRWLNAESHVKQITGQFSQVFDDDIDLIANDSSPITTSNATNNSAFDQELVEPIVEKHSFDSHSFAQSSDSSETLSELALDSATVQIHKLEDELKKVVADRQHWRALATQKSENDEELDRNRARIKELESTVLQLQERCEQLSKENENLSSELLELDQQHEQALNKVLIIKDELQSQNNALVDESEKLKKQNEILENDKSLLETEVEALRETILQSKKDLNSTIANDEDSNPSSVADITPLKQKREEPEGAPLPDNEDNQQNSQQNPNFKTILSAVHELSSDNLELEEKLKLSDEQNHSLRSDVLRIETQLDDNLLVIKQLEERLKSTVEDRDRLLHRMKDCESLQAENQSLKTSVTNSKLSLDQLQRDYDQLLIQNRYLEDENKRKTPNDDSMAKESFKKMSQLIRDKDEEIVSLKQRVDSLLNTIETERQKISEDEKMEQINKLSHELSRLREHLIAVEDGYTQELVVAEERENELRIRLKATEEQLEAIQNRFQAERYEEQIRSLCTQRDIARNEVSQLDDKLQQYAASVANLQLVIEQIQKENERKLQFAERQHRIELEAEKARTEDVLKKLKSQENRFADTLEALGAASRLSESIDIKEQTIAQMKIEASKKDSLIYALRQEIDELKASSEGKVDKQIMKSLIIGYFVAPQDKRHEVERLLARFLDFNQQEMERAKIVIGRKRTPSGNWIPFFGGSTSDSLSLKFVQFLENESKPNPTDKPFIPSKEIARDLSKSLITNTSQQQRSNPFLASASPLSLSSLGSRNSSANSSTDNLNNQLLMGPTMTSFTPLIVSTPNSDESVSRNNSNNDILRNVLEKQ